MACAAPAYFAARGTPLTPADLAGHDCLRLVRGRRAFDRWRFSERGESVEVQVDGPLASTSAEVIHDWALGGHGVAFKAEWDIADDLRDGRLLECLAPFASDEIHLYGIFPARPASRSACAR